MAYYGRTSFGVFKEPQTAGDYTYNKKAKTTFCNPNVCVPSRKVNTESNLILLKRSNDLNYYNYMLAFNHSNLNNNLLTHIDLSNVHVIQSNNTPFQSPTDLSNNTPYLNYVIDPSGSLFGNTICGENNYLHYLLYNPISNKQN